MWCRQMRLVGVGVVMTDRLAEIDARTAHNREVIEARLGASYFDKRTDCVSDREWLIASVRELRAQAALDAAVREVAREVVDWYNLVDLVNRVKILKVALVARDAAVTNMTEEER